jgi:hypothetical protein
MYIPYVWIVLALTIWLIDIVLPCVSKHGKCCSLQCLIAMQLHHIMQCMLHTSVILA